MNFVGGQKGRCTRCDRNALMVSSRDLWLWTTVWYSSFSLLFVQYSYNTFRINYCHSPNSIKRKTINGTTQPPHCSIFNFKMMNHKITFIENMFVILINREPRNHIIKFASFMLIPYYKYNLCNLTSPSQPQSKSSYSITLFYHNHHLVVAQNVYSKNILLFMFCR